MNAKAPAPAPKPEPDLNGPLRTILVSFLRTADRTRVCTATYLDMDTTGRQRIPDVMVLRRQPHGSGRWEEVPIIVIEIKSPEDTFDHILNSCIDYHKLMVFNILVLDPENGRAWLFSKGSLRLIDGPSVELPIDREQTIFLPFTAMFGELHYRFDWRRVKENLHERE